MSALVQLSLADRTVSLHPEKWLSLGAITTRNSRSLGESLSHLCDCRLAVTVVDLRSPLSSDRKYRGNITSALLDCTLLSYSSNDGTARFAAHPSGLRALDSTIRRIFGS